MVTIKQGDATSPRPQPNDGVVLAHLCNNIGAWGRGFVLAVDKVSPVPKAAYKALFAQCCPKILLGTVQIIECWLAGVPDGSHAGQYFIANMIAQSDIRKNDIDNPCLVIYDALEVCLREVFSFAAKLGYPVHMPEGIGSGLAGGDKSVIRGLIEKVALECSADVTLWEYSDSSSVSYVPTTKTGSIEPS